MLRPFLPGALAATILGMSVFDGAHAQTASGTAHTGSPAQIDPLGSPMAEGPIVAGKHVQPKGEPTQAGAADADQLLREGEHSPAAHSQPVVPRDLYGQPMGGDPGLNPPDPNPHVETTPPAR